MNTMAGGMGASMHLSVKFQSRYLLWSQINELGTSHISVDTHRLIFNHTQKCRIIFIKWILITCVIIETDFKQGNPENISRETITFQSCVCYAFYLKSQLYYVKLRKIKILRRFEWPTPKVTLPFTLKEGWKSL